MQDWAQLGREWRKEGRKEGMLVNFSEQLCKYILLRVLYATTSWVWCAAYIKYTWSNSDSVAVGQARGKSQVPGLGTAYGSGLLLALMSESWCTFSECGALPRKDRWEFAVSLARTAIAMETSIKGIQRGIIPRPGKQGDTAWWWGGEWGEAQQPVLTQHNHSYV